MDAKNSNEKDTNSQNGKPGEQPEDKNGSKGNKADRKEDKKNSDGRNPEPDVKPATGHFTGPLDEIPTKEFPAVLAARQKEYTDRGEHSGASGLVCNTALMEEQALAEVGLLQDEVMIMGASAVAQLGKKKKDEGDYYEGINERLIQANYEQDWLYFGRRHAMHQYSWTSVFLYSFFGVFLIMADIPLAVQLVQKGFAFEGPGPDHPELQLHALMTRFWPVIQANWEAFLTATGIAFCTAFIKLSYDEYIASPYGASTLKRRAFRRLVERKKGSNELPLSDDEEKEYKREDRAKFITKMGILSLTLVMIVVLGQFRTSALGGLKKYNQVQAEQKDVLNNQGEIDFQEKEKELKDIDEKAKSSNETYNNESGKTNLLTFIFITLLFPIVSGACFSLAISALQNKCRVWKSRIWCRTLKKKADAEIIKANETEGRLAAWYELLTKVKDNTWIEATVKGLVACYRCGYANGLMQPDLLGRLQDPIALMETWRGRKINVKANKDLNQSLDNQSKNNGNGKNSNPDPDPKSN